MFCNAMFEKKKKNLKYHKKKLLMKSWITFWGLSKNLDHFIIHIGLILQPYQKYF